jgi:uncharacterized protein (TIGR03437 family)
MSMKRLLLLPILVSGAGAQFYTIQTFAGGGMPYDENALTAHLHTPVSPVLDQQGNLYVSLVNYHIVVRIGGSVVTRVAGTGTQGFSGDGGPALNAQLSSPTGLAVDPSGNLYIYDSGNYRIRKLDAQSGSITTVAGSGKMAMGPSGTVGGPATSLLLSSTGQITIDPGGNLYILDELRVVKVDAASSLVTSKASVNNGGGFLYGGIASDSSGDIFFIDGNSIRRIDEVSGAITTVAGALTNALGDGGPATSAGLNMPTAVAVDAAGDIYIGDSGNSRVRRIAAASGTIQTVAGNGGCGAGLSGLGGPATAASLCGGLGVAVDPAGSVFITSWGSDYVLRVDSATGVLTAYAGDGQGQFSGDGEAAIYSQVSPGSIAVDGSGNVFIGEGGRIREVDAATGIIHTVAGDGTPGFTGVSQTPNPAGFSAAGVAVDFAGNIFIADSGNSRVLKVDRAGTLTTYAGGGTVDSDHGPATSLELGSATAVAVDANDNVFVADAIEGRVYKIDPYTRMMTLVAGAFGLKYGGDGGPATSTMLVNPCAIALDSTGNLFIIEEYYGLVRRVDAVSGIISTVAGFYNGVVDESGQGGDGGPATSAHLTEPSAIAVDAQGNIFISENYPGFVREVNAATQIISTIAGGASCGAAAPNGSPATPSCISYPVGLALGPGGVVYIAEQSLVQELIPIPVDEPVIGGVGNAAWFSAALSPGAWFAITGANLAASTRSWTDADFNGDLLPLSLDGVTVTVAGKPAAISYISPGQINAQCPDIAFTGTSASVKVQVSIQGNLSNAFAATLVSSAPALFATWSDPPSSGIPLVVAEHADGTVVSNSNPAVVGETISFFGTGFGPSNPPIAAGTMPGSPEPLAGAVAITPGSVSYAGIVGPGLVQINFTVPAEPGYGTALFTLVWNGVDVQQNVWVPVNLQ